METNTVLLAIVAIFIVALIIFMITKNNREKKKYVDEETQADIPVSKHDEPKI